MIQYWMKDILKQVEPEIRWTVDFQPDAQTYGTVFYEGGGQPGQYDFSWRYPRYMVWIESKDWGFAEYLAQKVFDTFHDYHKTHGPQDIDIEYYRNDSLYTTESVSLKSLSAAGGPNPLGVEEGRMRYSVNFDAVIIKNKGGENE